MTVSFRAAGSWENGATGLTADEVLSVPAAQVTGDMMLAIGCWKDFAITAQISGWTELIEQADGTTGTGNGLGSMKIGVWYKIATSDTEADPTLDFSTTTGLLGEGTIVVFSKSEANWLTPVALQAAWTSSGGPATISAGSTTTIPSGGAVIGIAAIRDDSATFTRGNSDIDDAGGLVTWNGNYTEQPATHASTTTGNDMAADAGYRLVTTGASGVTLRQSIQALSAAETGNLVWVVLGDAPNPSGTGAVTTAATTVSGAGAETFTATGAATLAATTVAGVGEEQFTATGAVTTAAATVVGAGEEVFTATGAAALAATTVAGSGDHTESGPPSVTGTGAATLAATTTSGAGELVLTATGAASLAAATVAGAGALVITGSGELALAAASVVGSGIAGISGTGSILVPTVTVVGEGTRTGGVEVGGRAPKGPRVVPPDDDEVMELDFADRF